MIAIAQATAAQYKSIQSIAHQTWPVAYGTILPQAQIDYMLDFFYSQEALKDSVITKGHQYIIALEDEEPVGFASYEHQEGQKPETKIHKIYILPKTQGKGIGKKLIEFIKNKALENHSSVLSLHVNRFNTALHFYEKIGFTINQEIDIQLEHGYLMEDYVMHKPIGE
jgi:diamine N-acetyltransferase